MDFADLCVLRFCFRAFARGQFGFSGDKSVSIVTGISFRQSQAHSLYYEWWERTHGV